VTVSARPLRVLLVEDSEDDARLILGHLRREGYEVASRRVETADAMREALGHEAWDVILSDNRMPRFSAMGAIELLRASGLDVPFIVVSGAIGEETAVQLLQAGAADYCRKDDLARLAPAIERERREAVVRRERRQAADALVRSQAELHQAVEELRRSEAYFRSLIEHDTDLIVILDAAAVVRYLSPSFKQALGYEPADLVGSNAFDLVHPDDQSGAKAALERAIADPGIRPRVEYRFRHQDGTGRHLESTATNLLADPGVAGIVINTRDVTERRQTEDALKLFRALIDSGKDIFEIVDPGTGRMLDVNETGCRELGYSREEFLELSVWDVDPDADRAVFAELSQALTTSGALMWEGLHRRKDGSTFPVEVSLQLVRHGRSYVVATARNITDRRRAEAELRLQGAALNAAANAIVITERDGRIVWANSAFTALSGYSVEEAVGRNPRDLVKSGAHDQAFYRSLWDTILAGKVWRGEMTNRRKDGSHYPEELTITPVPNAHGEITHFIAVKTDLTEENRLKAQFLQSQKMEGVGQLAGGIAHDFNNLLTVINGAAAFAATDLKEDNPLQEDLRMIQQAGEQAAALTRQLLAFSRRQIMTLEVVDLNALVANLQSMLQRLIGEDIELVVVPAQGLGSVRADRAQVEQVVLNLAINARDAMPRGGTLTIETRDVELDEAHAARHATVEPGPHVMLTVSDTGVGMDETTRLRIFEPFFTTKEMGRGTGLGLSTVYGIVKQSRGSIWVYSEPGKGTSFKVYFPRIEAAARKDRPARSPAPVRGTGTILVVEDDAAILRLAHRILGAAGYTVLTARNGGEALLLLERHVGPVDLMLTDVVMPEMGGPELAERLARSHPEMKVLFSSGYTDDTVLRHGVLASTAHFIAKPYSPAGLTHRVREVLES
jgi:PAS domain S-box-containing protein